MESEKYINLIEEGKIFSYSLSKGTFILPPKGFVLWEQIKKYLDYQFSFLNVENVNLPTLIPISLLKKEKDHIDGFSPELFLVKKNRSHDYEELGNSKNELVLRPTSEVLFYDWFSKLLQTYKQLPLLYNQWGQVFRVEKNTKPFLRNVEFLWQEGHTLHKNEEEAKDFSLRIINIYKDYIEKFLCISAIIGIKTSQERFAGALESYTIECLLPDYQCLQLATSHYFGENFSKAFNVRFRNKENKLIFPSSTSWGTSTRSIGALALSHSDELGLIFPFQVAPVQIAFIITKQNHDLDIYRNKIFDLLRKIYRCEKYDYSNQFSTNIMKADKEGCPIKIIIGLEDLKLDNLTVSLRISSREKKIIKKTKIFTFIKEAEQKIANYLFSKSLLIKKENTFKISKYENLVFSIKENKGLFLVPFCGNELCEKNVKKNFSPFSFRCISFPKNLLEDKCIFCSNSPSQWTYFGRSY